MELQQVQSLLDKQDGNHSEIYPLIAHRLHDYTDREITFAETFLFFEGYYLQIKKHMLENNVCPKKIIDIGCQHGFQTEIFPEFEYVGIDAIQHRWFNNERPNVRYILGTYPTEVHEELTDAAVISCMSLGYFNSFLEGCRDDDEEALDILVDSLKTAEHLYIATTPELLERLKSEFSTVEGISEHESFGMIYSLYYLRK